MHYRTKANDRLDVICGRHYGSQSGAVEAVLKANPGLSNDGPMLPAGLMIELPNLDPVAALSQTVRLWD